MTKKLIWRLGKLPTVEELQKLIIDKVITKEEAREILFKIEDDTDRDKNSLEDEIKFLKELVEKLSKNSPTIIREYITTIEKPYRQYPWYQPYYYWSNPTYCTAQAGTTTISSNTAQLTGSATSLQSSSPTSFSGIQTF